MTLRGSAFLPIWHDVDEPMEDEFNRWHTVEHMPERVDTPGIVVGRRYADPSAALHRYFTLYEASSFDVFSSEGYFATANARSEWTQRIHPAFQNFKRAPCHLVMTRGRGIGGALATVRIRFPGQEAGQFMPKDRFNLAARPLVENIATLNHITSVHVGVAGQVDRQPLSSESLSLRANAKAFDAVLMIEGISRGALEAAEPAIRALMDQEKKAIDSFEIGIYDLAYLLSDISGN